ncbi:MAG: TonB-dependent receptor [Bacteroidales bacterium]|nr:TonB-dependent receptor [Bacteroidales bacterium]
MEGKIMSAKLCRKLLVVLLSVFAHQYNLQAQSADSLLMMSLEELMNISVVTASNVKENLSKAPANVIVIDKNDIQLRGYKSVTDIYNDLPGMDIANTFGFQGVRNTVRGFRSPFGDSYLFMVDGIIYNHLWFNEAIAQNAVPLSNVERIEIVYGPASSVYGANAFMGVINVITAKDKETDGTSANISVTLGKNSFNGDYNLFYKKEDFRFSLTARNEYYSLFDRIDNDSYEWTKSALLNDRRLWGGVVDNQNFTAPPTVKNQGVDVRAYFGNFEVGAQQYNTDQGYGFIFPFDKALPSSEQPMTDYSFHARYQGEINEKLSVSSFIRYRGSNVDGETNFLEGYTATNGDTVARTVAGVLLDPGQSTRVVDYSTWGVLNTSFTFTQSAEYFVARNVLLSAGYKFEYKDLQKAWQYTYGNWYSPEVLVLGTPGFLVPPQALQRSFDNRIIWKDNGGYLLLKADINDNNTLTLGGRIDNNSAYGTALTLRGGYVLTVNKLTAKILYGQAFREPSPRTLYGDWGGSGADPDLEPERSQTIEASLGYTAGNLSALADAYYVINKNTIEVLDVGGSNLGERNIFGTDVFIASLVPITGLKQLKLWGYGSFIIKEEQQYFDGAGNKTTKDIIGDLAHTKIYFGATGTTNKYLGFSLRGRYIGERETVLSNPIRTIDGYFLLDANIIIKDIGFEGLNFNIQFNNILGTEYFHPGTRAATSGNTPGSWSGLEWQGSVGWNNSLMPQPGRYILIGVQFLL